MMIDLDEIDLVCRVGMKNLIENWIRSQILDRIHVLIIIMGDRMFDQSLFRILDRVHHRSVHLGEWMTNSMTESEDPSAERSPTPWAGSSS